jgi:saccharopepsin
MEWWSQTMGVTGTWRNSYDSVMTLQRLEGGLLVGRYSSHTGATGVYHVAGFVGEAVGPAPRAGSSVALSIFWRSIAGGEADPSWHWVSGLGGQLFETAEGRKLDLAHAMIATTVDLNGIPIGSYIDKLVFLPESGPEAGTGSEPRLELAETGPMAAASPREGSGSLGGEWRRSGSRPAEIILGSPDARSGFVRGRIELDGKRYRAIGFADVFAGPGGLRREALSLSALREDAGTLSLSGWLDRETGELVLTAFENRSTSPHQSYAQSVVSGLVLTR